MNNSKLFLFSIVFFFLITSFRKSSYSEQVHFSTSMGITIANSSIVEGNSGQRDVEVMVMLSQAAPGPISVIYTTRNGTATAGTNYVTANGSVNFSTGERMKKIMVPVIGNTICEPDKTFEIVLSNPSGATLVESIGSVTIVDDDCSYENLSIYEVQFTYVGTLTFYGDAADCNINLGAVVLFGLLSGYEKVSSYDDVVYNGVLTLGMDIDICSLNAIEDPQGGYPPCVISVVGRGLVKTELKIRFDHRGGYIKIEDETGNFRSEVFGSCDQEQIDEEKDMVPNRTIASVFNGTDLPQLTERTLRVGTYSESDGENVIIFEVIRKIR